MGAAGILFLAVVGVALPALALRTMRHLDAGSPVPSRAQTYATTISLQIALLGLAIVVARAEAIPLVGPVQAPLRDAVLAALVLAALVALVRRRSCRLSASERERLAFLLPVTHRERAAYASLVLVAAVGEEIAYRGVLFVLLVRLLGNPWTAAAGAAVLFGAAHAVQGWRSVATIAGVALVLHALVAATNGLHAAMAVHAAYDVAAAWMYARWRAEHGLPAAPQARVNEGA